MLGSTFQSLHLGGLRRRHASHVIDEMRRTGQPDIDIRLWSTEGNHAATALHICHTHCPVLNNCRSDVLDSLNTPHAYQSIIVGGFHTGRDGRINKRHPPPDTPAGCATPPNPHPDCDPTPT